MARTGIDYETVKHTAIKLLSQGIAPSVQKIREVLGTGSNTTIAEHLKQWREDYAKKSVHHLPANMPQELIAAFEVLWQTAMEQAQGQLSTYKQTLEEEREKMLHSQREFENAITNLKHDIAQLAIHHDEQAAKAHQSAIDLAITQERLEKNHCQLIEQKNNYEERLQHSYKEKEDLLLKQNELQTGMNHLHQQLAAQAEMHREALTQQQLLHEQSENRWLQLISSAKQEAINERKKLENLLTLQEGKNRGLIDQLSKTQQSYHDKSTELTMTLEKIGQLEKQIHALETEAKTSGAVILKLEEENALKNAIFKSVIKKSQHKEILDPQARISSIDYATALQEK